MKYYYLYTVNAINYNQSGVIFQSRDLMTSTMACVTNSRL